MSKAGTVVMTLTTIDRWDLIGCLVFSRGRMATRSALCARDEEIAT